MTDNEYMEKMSKAYIITLFSGVALLVLVYILFINAPFIILATVIIATIWLIVKVYMLYIYQVGKRYIDEHKKPLDKDK